jgi:Flp pilus assembly protein TadD
VIAKETEPADLKEPHAPTESSSQFASWSPAFLLALVTLGLYWPAMQCDFVIYDDQVYVSSNVHVQKGISLANIEWAFSNAVSANWHPVTMLSHMLDCQLFGLHSWGHHLTNVLLHTINTVLVFAFLRQTTGALWRSLFVASFFGLHPLRVESVAWIAERKDVLSGFLGLLSLMFYARYAQKRSVLEDRQFGPRPALSNDHQVGRVDYGLAMGFLGLGLMSKAMLVTWPFVMLLLDWWPLVRFKSCGALRLLREKIPFFILAALSSVVTFLVQKHSGAMAAEENLTFGARSENALISYCRYLGKIIWPTNLAVLYPHPGHWQLEKVLLAGVLMAGISVLVWVKRRRYPFLLMGWLWYCGTLVPVIGVVQVGAQAMADRYTYIPSLGVLILAVWGCYELVLSRACVALPLSVAGTLGILVCFELTRHALGYFKDSETLFRQTLKVTKENYYAHNNLGSALYSKGRVDEAIVEFQEALRLKPGYAECHNNLGVALDSKGRIDEAIREYQQALRFKPDVAEIHHILGVNLGKKGMIDEAILQLQEAIRLKPDDAMAHNDLGNALDSKGQTDEAIIEYEAAIRLEPNSVPPHANLGAALGKKGNIDGAILQLQEALRLQPDDALARYNLGTAFEQKGMTNEAILQLQEALRLKPEFAEARRLISALGVKNAAPNH